MRAWLWRLRVARRRVRRAVMLRLGRCSRGHRIQLPTDRYCGECGVPLGRESVWTAFRLAIYDGVRGLPIRRRR